MLVLADLIFIIVIFTSRVRTPLCNVPTLPYSPAQQNVEKFLRNGIMGAGQTHLVNKPWFILNKPGFIAIIDKRLSTYSAYLI